MSKRIFLFALVGLGSLAMGACRRPAPEQGLEEGTGAPPAQLPAAASGQPPASLQAGLESLGFQTPAEPLRIIDFTLPDLQGTPRSLASFAGQVVFLNFWATWCPPCRAEMPSMESLHRALGSAGLVVLAVNSQEPPEEVRRLVETGGFSFPVLLDQSGQVGSSYAVRAIPTTYLVGRDGYILGRMTGGRDWYTAETLAVLRRVLGP